MYVPTIQFHIGLVSIIYVCSFLYNSVGVLINICNFQIDWKNNMG